MEEFYKIQFEQKSNEVLLDVIDDYNDQELRSGKHIPKNQIKLKVSEGKKFYDIIRLQDPFNFIISLKVYKLLKDNNITGWRYYEVEIEGYKEEYYGFQVLGRAGLIKRPKSSGFVIGLDFKYDSWDKNDFFSPEGTMAILCTERVKEIFSLNKITNIKFENIKKVKWYST